MSRLRSIERHQVAAAGRAQVVAMRSSAGNIEVVAPSSAPMLVIVALPVALIVRAPGPIYSTIALVPPATVSCSGDIEDHVLGCGPAAQLAGQIHRDVPRVEHLPRQAGDHLDRVRAADADRAGAETAGVRRVRVGADDQRAGEGIVLQHHLVDDAGARSPEAAAILRRRRAQEIVDLLVLGERLAQIRRAARPAPGSGGRSGSSSAPRPGPRRVCMNCSSPVCPSTSWNTTRSGRSSR